MWLRQLLLWENGDQLWFGRATPREWLEDGKTVRIENAGTLFGTAGMVLNSEVGRKRIRASLQVPTQAPPKEVWLTSASSGRSAAKPCSRERSRSARRLRPRRRHPVDA